MELEQLQALAWFVVGALVGLLLSIMLKLHSSQAILKNMVLGILGALIGGVLFHQLGAGGVTGFSGVSLMIAVIGAITLVELPHLFRAKHPTLMK